MMWAWISLFGLTAKARRLISGSVFERILRRLTRRTRDLRFETSAQYWEDRYKTGGSSGAGSYGRLAKFKAEVINRFVREHGVQSVIEFGCGDGSQLSLLEIDTYLGFDVSDRIVETCQARFRGDAGKTFRNLRDHAGETADLTLSLDVVYHLVEDAVFDDYMRRLFSSATRYVMIYSSDSDGLEAVGSASHVRHRKFTNWIAAQAGADWTAKAVVRNRYPFDAGDPKNTSFADFHIFERAS